MTWKLESSASGAPNLVDAAVNALQEPGHPPSDAIDHVPTRPGLYAIHAPAAVWDALTLGPPADCRPLYAGKAERSLRSRDLKLHFATGKTGWSTVRRSLASRLHKQLDLVACPRNIDKPERFANFGLERDGDERLTDWMHANLTIAVWEWRAVPGVSLKDVETDVLRTFSPPLNIDKVITAWRSDLKLARAVMARAAAGWVPPR